MNKITGSSCIVMLVTGVLIATCFQVAIGRLQPTNAQIGDGSVRLLSYTSSQLFGIAQGQTGRFCVGTLTSAGPDLDWTGRISDERGNLLLQLPTKHSAAGTWSCADIPRSSLGISGDPLTGRAQVAARLFIEVPLGTKSSEFSGVFELVNDADGKSGAIAGIIITASSDNNR